MYIIPVSTLAGLFPLTMEIYRKWTKKYNLLVITEDLSVVHT